MRAALVAAILIVPAVAHGQSVVCRDAEVAFVGRAAEPVTFHISGEPVIERARKNLARVEEENARERAALDTLDPATRVERETELEIRRIRAFDELDHIRIMYPPPHDLTLIPMQVEHPLRGVTEPTLLLSPERLQIELQPGQSYLVIGARSPNNFAPLPELYPHLSLPDSYVQVERAVPAAAAGQEISFLAATRSGATILGVLRRHGWGDGMPPPIGGTRIVVSSGGRELETVTKDDGSFAVFGIPAGEVEVMPVLPADLAIVNKSASKMRVADGACREVLLTAEVNGRVRGRVISASDRSIKGAMIHLSSIDAARFRLNPSVGYVSSHSPRLTVPANEDGTFQFTGVPEGTYLLTAYMETTIDGRTRRITTFYPGTSDQSFATPVTVGHATEHEGFDFVVRTE